MLNESDNESQEQPKKAGGYLAAFMKKKQIEKALPTKRHQVKTKKQARVAYSDTQSITTVTDTTEDGRQQEFTDDRSPHNGSLIPRHAKLHKLPSTNSMLTATDVTHLDNTQDITSACTILDFLVISVCKYLKLSTREAVEALTTNQQGLLDALLQEDNDKKGTRLLAHTWLAMINEHVHDLVVLTISEPSALHLALDAFAVAYRSQKLSIVEATSHLIFRYCQMLFYSENKSVIELIWSWFVSVNGGLDSVLFAYLRHRHQKNGSIKPILFSLIFQLSRGHLRSLFEFQLRSRIIDSVQLLEFIYEFLEFIDGSISVEQQTTDNFQRNRRMSIEDYIGRDVIEILNAMAVHYSDETQQHRIDVILASRKLSQLLHRLFYCRYQPQITVEPLQQVSKPTIAPNTNQGSKVSSPITSTSSRTFSVQDSSPLPVADNRQLSHFEQPIIADVMFSSMANTPVQTYDVNTTYWVQPMASQHPSQPVPLQNPTELKNKEIPSYMMDYVNEEGLFKRASSENDLKQRNRSTSQPPAKKRKRRPQTDTTAYCETKAQQSTITELQEDSNVHQNRDCLLPPIINPQTLERKSRSHDGLNRQPRSIVVPEKLPEINTNLRQLAIQRKAEIDEIKRRRKEKIEQLQRKEQEEREKYLRQKERARLKYEKVLKAKQLQQQNEDHHRQLSEIKSPHQQTEERAADPNNSQSTAIVHEVLNEIMFDALQIRIEPLPKAKSQQKRLSNNSSVSEQGQQQNEKPKSQLKPPSKFRVPMRSFFSQFTTSQRAIALYLRGFVETLIRDVETGAAQQYLAEKSIREKKERKALKRLAAKNRLQQLEQEQLSNNVIDVIVLSPPKPKSDSQQLQQYDISESYVSSASDLQSQSSSQSSNRRQDIEGERINAFELHRRRIEAERIEEAKRQEEIELKKQKQREKRQELLAKQLQEHKEAQKRLEEEKQRQAEQELLEKQQKERIEREKERIRRQKEKERLEEYKRRLQQEQEERQRLEQEREQQEAEKRRKQLEEWKRNKQNREANNNSLENAKQPSAEQSPSSRSDTSAQQFGDGESSNQSETGKPRTKKKPRSRRNSKATAVESEIPTSAPQIAVALETQQPPTQDNVDSKQISPYNEPESKQPTRESGLLITVDTSADSLPPPQISRTPSRDNISSSSRRDRSKVKENRRRQLEFAMANHFNKDDDGNSSNTKHTSTSKQKRKKKTNTKTEDSMPQSSNNEEAKLTIPPPPEAISASEQTQTEPPQPEKAEPEPTTEETEPEQQNVSADESKADASLDASLVSLATLRERLKSREREQTSNA